MYSEVYGFGLLTFTSHDLHDIHNSMTNFCVFILSSIDTPPDEGTQYHQLTITGSSITIESKS